MQKVYVDETNKATIVCPKCGFGKTIDTTRFKGTQKKLKSTCRCGETYQLTIEFRRRHRKNVRLPGSYVVKESGEKGDIIIRELSLSGIRIESMNPHGIMINNSLQLTFRLDNPMRTEISKLVKVVWIKDRLIGAYYLESKLYEKDLGFYLQT